MEFRNGCMMCKNKTKPGPLGMSRNQAYSLPEEWNGRNCLLKIDDTSVIRKLKDELGGDELVSFSTLEFSVLAEKVFNSLNIWDLTFENVWVVFQAMLPLMIFN